MLVLIVLCAYLRTLQGAPLLPLHASSFVAVVDFIGRDAPVDPDCGGPQCRTVYSIVQSCLLTIFTCVWTSLHPNINGPNDSNCSCFKRKVVTMLCVVIAPELVLLWALRQYVAAKAIAKKYNKKFAKSEADSMVQPEKSLLGKVAGWFLSLWEGIIDWFLPLPDETSWREDGQLWTTTHGFFIQMGGFILHDSGRPKQVLDYERLEHFLEQKAIDAPSVTERDLQDRSKGDTISKAIVVLQTTWFVFQCIARAGQRLPLSELEVLTLAFAVMNVAIYVAWWDKPQSVGMAICVPLKRRTEDKLDGTMMPLGGEVPHMAQNLSQTERVNLLHSDSEHSIMFDKGPLMSPYESEPGESAGEKHSWHWLRRKLRDDRNQHSAPVFFLLRLPYRIVLSVFRPLGKIMTTDNFNKNDLRVPMFYASDKDCSDGGILLVSCGVGTIFGAIHLLAWASQFPSPRDIVLWRVSAIVLTVSPFLVFLFPAIQMLDMESALDKFVITKYTVKCMGYLAIFLVPFYIIGRFVVIVIALLAIHNPPRDVLRDISWTLYIPHF